MRAMNVFAIALLCGAVLIGGAFADSNECSDNLVQNFENKEKELGEKLTACIGEDADETCCDQVKELFAQDGTLGSCLCNADFYDMVLETTSAGDVTADEMVDMFEKCSVPVPGTDTCGGGPAKGPKVKAQVLFLLKKKLLAKKLLKKALLKKALLKKAMLAKSLVAPRTVVEEEEEEEEEEHVVVPKGKKKAVVVEEEEEEEEEHAAPAKKTPKVVVAPPPPPPAKKAVVVTPGKKGGYTSTDGGAETEDDGTWTDAAPTPAVETAPTGTAEATAEAGATATVTATPAQG